MVGSTRQQSNSLGPPAAAMALFRTVTQSAETFLAIGCGLKTTELPAASMLIELLMIVSVEFVQGMIEAITPHGSKRITVSPSLPLMVSGFCNISGPGVFSVTRWFLMI